MKNNDIKAGDKVLYGKLLYTVEDIKPGLYDNYLLITCKYIDDTCFVKQSSVIKYNLD